MRDYVAALDARDGAAVCALFVPGALDEVELPVRARRLRRARWPRRSATATRAGCRSGRGRGSRGVDASRFDAADAAKVVATVVTGFADRDEASIEDDVVYLGRDGGGWLIAKPSSTLYRAVGIADVPPSVLDAPLIPRAGSGSGVIRPRARGRSTARMRRRRSKGPT